MNEDRLAALQGKLPIGQQSMVVQQIYLANVFPGMKIAWGTYPNNIGHMAFPGCFRCHDGQRATKGGDTITQDCSVCHEPMAVDEQNPAILKTLGMEQGKGT